MLSEQTLNNFLIHTRWRVSSYDTVESTNLLIKDALHQGEPEGKVVVALEQTGGYGRQGRRWTSPWGGVYFSLLLRPASEKLVQETSTISLVAALALRQALQHTGLSSVQIKWPNDVLVKQGKLAGISLEGTAGGICMGIGINVFLQEAFTSFSDRYQTSFLAQELSAEGLFPLQEQGAPAEKQSFSPVQETLFLQTVSTFLQAFERFYSQWLTDGFEPFCSGYNSVLFNKGQLVVLQDINQNQLVEGVVCGVNNKGQLCLRQSDGTCVYASSGEVHTIQ